MFSCRFSGRLVGCSLELLFKAHVNPTLIQQNNTFINLHHINLSISMGLQEKLESLQLELSKASDSSDNQTLKLLKEKVDRIMLEFYHNLTRPGAYLGLKQKLEMLNMAHRLIELKEKGEKLKTEINQKVPAEVITKMEVLKEAQKKLSEGDPFDEE